MDPNRWKQIDELVDAALEVPENERDAFVAEKAAGDHDLRLAVSKLLGAQSKTNAFLQNSAMKIVAKALADDEPEVKPGTFLDKTVGTYKIERLLGAGGMGEVYLAFDQKMKRKVALKILPREYGTNDERVRRFEMEARAISSINHPNIVTIYDVGNVDGVNYIATEYVEGKTLRDLSGGKFKMRNVMANSIQLCDALSAAHQAGIIHRDIKPENIMIRRDGYAKILDFGVAKLTEPGGQVNREFANTTKGMIIGTPAYMSPSQVTGDQVDHRTDIWSCGVVLYEFITGKNPFKGANRQATFHAILTSDPELSSTLNPDIPEELDHILAKILEKDPDLGYQTASDLRADLKRVKRELDSSSSGSFSGQSSRFYRKAAGRQRWIKTAAAFAALLLASAAVWAIFFRKPTSNAPEWSSAANSQLTVGQGTEFFPSLSPDGKSFVYAADTGGQFDIYYQRVGGKNPQNLTPDSSAEDTEPAFSPDGELIAFRSEREPKGIYVMGASGENLRRVADFGFHPSWSPDGKELVVSTFGLSAPSVRVGRDNSLWIVTLDTGAKRHLVKEEASFPTWSPNGKRIAYWVYGRGVGRRDVVTIASDGTGEPIVVTRDFAVSNWNPVWSPDGQFLYFVSDKSGNLNFWRVAIDQTTGAVLSEPEPIVAPSRYSRHLNFSRDGRRMIYVQTDNKTNIKGVEFDPKNEKPVGEPFWITSGEREMVRAELSPDGSHFVMRMTRRTQDDIVVVGRDGSNWTDITNDVAFDRYPRWSPDGKQIAFASDRNKSYEIWVCNADGTNLRQVTFQYEDEGGSSFPTWSPDGKSLIYTNKSSSYIIDLTRTWEEQQAPRRLFPTIDNFTVWDWSPDGKKLVGNLAGSTAIGVYAFETGQIERIVENMGSLPSWLPDSRRFIYEMGNKIMIADVETKKTKVIISGHNENMRAPFVSRDGRLVYFSVHDSESNIWLLDAGPVK